jgi:hypothetical protein
MNNSYYWDERINEDALSIADSISNPTVKSQVITVLSEMIRVLQAREPPLSRLPKPEFMAKSDGSGVLKWDFGHIQVGASFENDRAKSCCYYLYRDDSIGALTYMSREISKSPSPIIAKMADFIVKNK